MGLRIRRASSWMGPALVSALIVVPAIATTSHAQTLPCTLVAPWELTEATGAAFGPGEVTDGGCTWLSETRAGHVLTVIVDLAQEPTVRIITDDPSIDVDAVSGALATLVADRVASGEPPPAAPPRADDGTRSDDLCALITVDDAAALLGIAMKPYGSQGRDACGYLGDEPGRLSIDLLVGFDDGELTDIPADWPEAVELDIGGLAALEYGWSVGSSTTVYLSVDTEAGLLTAKVTYDDTDIDPADVARGLVETVLAEMGHALG